MADDVSKAPGPFDVRTVRALVALMSQHELNEIDLHDGSQRIRLRRGVGGVLATPVSVAAPPLAAPAQVSAAPKVDGATAPSAAGKKLSEIKSPTPGTFYSSASPDAQPFVKAGAKVSPSTVVCLIEAMKIFNEITAECTGTIAEILVENQQAVEYGQVLFRVDPTS